MDQSVIKKLLDLGFEQRMENVYSIVAENKLFATMNYWEIFVCFENGKHFISNNGDLVENFDAPNIVLDEAVKNIKERISKFGCVLNVSRIVKEFEPKDFDRALSQFVEAVNAVDKMYEEL